MATSDKRIQANRRNAKLSTGPRTDDGKARSSMNGFKHPWLGVSTIMTEEDKLAMKEFVSAYIEDLAPLGAAEIQLAHTLVRPYPRDGLHRRRAVVGGSKASKKTSSPGATKWTPA